MTRFVMLYYAILRAGIDLREVEIIEKEEQIIIYMPMPKITIINIKPASLKFFDNQKGLIKLLDDDKKCLKEALEKAENDLKNNFGNQLIETAEKQALEIINGIIKIFSNKKNIKIVNTYNKENLLNGNNNFIEDRKNNNIKCLETNY